MTFGSKVEDLGNYYNMALGILSLLEPSYNRGLPFLITSEKCFRGKVQGKSLARAANNAVQRILILRMVKHVRPR